MSLQREVESWRKSGEVTGSFTDDQGLGPNDRPAAGSRLASAVSHFHFWHMLQVNHVTTKENKNERFTGLSPGYQIVSLFGSFQTHTHAKWEIHQSVALTFGAKPWKLQKFSTVSLLSLSTIFSVKSTAKWVTKKCSEWLCFLCPVQCTFLFVWDKNHYMPQQTAKNKIK